MFKKKSSIIWLWKRPAAKGELELLFVLPEVHSKGFGQAAWKAVEAMHPERVLAAETLLCR